MFSTLQIQDREVNHGPWPLIVKFSFCLDNVEVKTGGKRWIMLNKKMRLWTCEALGPSWHKVIKENRSFWFWLHQPFVYVFHCPGISWDQLKCDWNNSLWTCDSRTIDLLFMCTCVCVCMNVSAYSLSLLHTCMHAHILWRFKTQDESEDCRRNVSVLSCLMNWPQCQKYLDLYYQGGKMCSSESWARLPFCLYYNLLKGQTLDEPYAEGWTLSPG